jgi:hypothetical protein
LSHRGEHALERISGPQMDPMLGREVIKRQQIEGVERLVGPRTTPRLSSFRNFFPQGFPCCEVTTTSSRLEYTTDQFGLGIALHRPLPGSFCPLVCRR